MIDAKEAKKKTQEVVAQNNDFIHQLNLVMNVIENAIKEGKFECIYDKTLSERAIEQLKFLGYKMNKMRLGLIKISWR